MKQQFFTRLKEYKNAKGETLGTLVTGEQANLWSQLDSNDDKIEGTSTAKAYADSKMPKDGKEIIVAVIDSGVDIKHEDLKGKIWENFAEIGGKTGVDDDANGYVDDFYGWNFLGAKDGTSINGNTLELTREYARLKKKKAKNGLTEREKVYFAKISEQYDAELKEAQDDLRSYEELMLAIKLLKTLGLKEETAAAVQSIESEDPEVKNAKVLASWVFSNPRIGSSAALQEIIDDANIKVQFQYNPNFNSSKIVGDNASVLDETGYGNNDVDGPDSLHGTHVAGIIAANRDNQLGILGQADTVKIMSLRAVPNGDERDKDVANAIFYAVKNGAKVINMSFGKEYSPQKYYVDEAVAYAEKHGVILVHAAGNSGKNTETGNNNFPNKKNQPAKIHCTRSLELDRSWRFLKTKNSKTPCKLFKLR
jgi:cell wall-associated protease